jgi:archaellum component FlaC
LQVFVKKERTLKDIFSSQLQQVKNITDSLSERVKKMEVDIEKVSNERIPMNRWNMQLLPILVVPI